MHTFKLAHTDLELSRIGLGTMHLGGSWDAAPVTADIIQQAERLFHTAVEQGINLIDLADIYTRGKSDAVVGEVLQANPELRDKLVLQAKCGIIFADEPEPGDPGRYDFSYEHIVTAVEGTLRRLQIDRVDILALHRPDPLMEPEEVARAFDHLQQSGKVGYFGVSNHTAGQLALLQKYLDQPLVVNQLELNLLHHDLINDGLVANMREGGYSGVSGTLDYCRLHDITIQAWSPVAGGRLFNPPDDAPQQVQNVAQEISQLAETHGTTKEAIALAWLLRHPASIQPIVGTQNRQRLIDSCRADEVQLSRIEWYRLLEAARGKPVP